MKLVSISISISYSAWDLSIVSLRLTLKSQARSGTVVVIGYSRFSAQENNANKYIYVF